MVSTPNLYELARGLELRWRIRVFLGHLITVLVVSTALSLLTAIVHVVSWMVIPTGRVILMANGAAVVVALVLTALRRRSPQLLLADADRTYETRELLSSAIEFAQTEPSNASDAERAFRDLVAKQGDDLSTMVDPATVYPIRMPRLTSVVGALAVALGVLLLLNASGWFAGSPVELAQEGLLLEETGRRLADRGASEELQELADEIRRLGERLRSGEMDPEEARRRIDQLGEHVEEQMRNLERLGEFDTNQEMDLPPETEDAVRSALRSGMTEGEVLDFFARMRSDGENLPDTLRALDEASPDMAADTDLGLDDDRIQELLNQLNASPESVLDRDLSEQLQNAQRTLQQAGAGLQSLTEGDDSDFGEPGDPRDTAAGQADGPTPANQPGGNPMDGGGDTQPGQMAGEMPVEDAMDDAFSRIEGANPMFRQIEGIVGEGTIRDVIVRELPSKAVSQMTDLELETAYERVIEEAIGRANTPPELQHLVRSYFLRITLGSDQGVQNEQ